MINTFSERQTISIPVTLKIDEMPDALRNRLWNLIKQYLHEIANINGALEGIWDEFFKEDTDILQRAPHGHAGYEALPH